MLLHASFFFLQVIQKNQNLTSKTADPPSAAILAVYLDQAHDLPVSLTSKEVFFSCGFVLKILAVTHTNVLGMLQMRKGNKDPSPMVQISVQDTTKESKVRIKLLYLTAVCVRLMSKKLFLSTSPSSVSADLLWNQQPCVGGCFYFLHSGSQQTGHRHTSKSPSEVNKQTR